MNNKLWTELDIKYLKDNYHLKSVKDISEYLGRSIHSIFKQASKQGLTNKQELKGSRFWKADEIDLLKKIYVDDIHYNKTDVINL